MMYKIKAVIFFLNTQSAVTTSSISDMYRPCQIWESVNALQLFRRDKTAEEHAFQWQTEEMHPPETRYKQPIHTRFCLCVREQALYRLDYDQAASPACCSGSQTLSRA